MVNFDALVDEGMIERRDLDLFDFADDAESAWTTLVRRGLVAHTPPSERPDNGRPAPR